MTQVEILEELKFTIPERLKIVEATLRLIREDLQRARQPLTRTERRRQLATAAEALLPDYVVGGELTVFTALDSEDFGVKKSGSSIGGARGVCPTTGEAFQRSDARNHQSIGRRAEH